MIELQAYLAALRESTEEISVTQAYQKQVQGVILIDIREKDETQSGSPVDALRISKGLLEMQIEQSVSNPQQEVMLLCASGRRSLIAARSLAQMGYQRVFSVAGGFQAWKDTALPFEVPTTLSPEDTQRYKRHLSIPEVGEKGQMKLLKSKVLIVGAGGIGSPVAWYLAAAGVGTLGIVDDDIVDKTNLQRQILHTEKSVGSLKVDSAKERLIALNSAITIHPISERLTAANVESIVKGYDVVIDGTDNFTTRYLINDACVKLGIPNVHGSVFRFEGQVSTFWPGSQVEKAPCYRCVYAEPPPPNLSQSCAEAGVLGVLPGLVGLLCATETIKILVGIGTNLIGKLLTINALSWDFSVFEIDQDPQCPYCTCHDVATYPSYVDYAAVCSTNA